MAGLDAGKLSYNTFTFHRGDLTQRISHDPLSPFDGDGAVTVIVNGDEVGETVWPILRCVGQRLIDDIVHGHMQAGEFEGWSR